MKITAGLGTLDDYIPFVEAGADELFCGFVPFEWMERAGVYEPLNRREVLYYNVQIGSISEMKILAKMVSERKVPVTITLNALHYDPERYPLIEKTMEQSVGLGFTSFIIADTDLIRYLKDRSDKTSILGLPVRIHLSGEAGISNHYLLKEMAGCGVVRMIFGRETSPEEMKAIISEGIRTYTGEGMEYEAFVLNERCHFTGAYCNSLHCDAFAPACRVPYIIGNRTGAARLSAGKTNATESEETDSGSFLPGVTGCGLCALWRLREAGVTELKVVSRGNYSEDTIRDIKSLKSALGILEQSSSEEEFIAQMKGKLFRGSCSHNCYYRMI